MKKSIAVLMGLGFCATTFAWGINVQLSPTPISSPRTIKANAKDTIHLDTSGLSKGAVYDIKCMLSAQKKSGGVYAAFLTKNIGGGAKLTFDGKNIVVNQNVIVTEKAKALAAQNVTIRSDQMIVIENRDGKGSLDVGACEATPKVIKPKK